MSSATPASRLPLVLLAVIALVLPAAGQKEADSTRTLAALPSTQTPHTLPAGKRQLVDSLVPQQAPKVTKQVAPRYPSLARRARIEGTVSARILVDTEGKVARIEMIRGQKLFYKAVKEAAGQWQFSPALQGQRPVAAWITVPFSFEL